jgi:hypothetical protein
MNKIKETRKWQKSVKIKLKIRIRLSDESGVDSKLYSYKSHINFHLHSGQNFIIFSFTE